MMAPHPAARLVLVPLFWAFAYLDHNPIVRLVAKLHLSPAPFERYTGYRGLFSGMTESAHAAAHFHWFQAFRSNPLSLPFFAVTLACILLWKFPRFDTKRKELTFFSFVILGTAINNIPMSQ